MESLLLATMTCVQRPVFLHVVEPQSEYSLPSARPRLTMNIVFVLNDAPYGAERCYNALRLAGALAKSSSNEVRVFLFGDGVLASACDPDRRQSRSGDAERAHIRK